MSTHQHKGRLWRMTYRGHDVKLLFDKEGRIVWDPMDAYQFEDQLGNIHPVEVDGSFKLTLEEDDG